MVGDGFRVCECSSRSSSSAQAVLQLCVFVIVVQVPGSRLTISAGTKYWHRNRRWVVFLYLCICVWYQYFAFPLVFRNMCVCTLQCCIILEWLWQGWMRKRPASSRLQHEELATLHVPKPASPTVLLLLQLCWLAAMILLVRLHVLSCVVTALPPQFRLCCLLQPGSILYIRRCCRQRKLQPVWLVYHAKVPIWSTPDCFVPEVESELRTNCAASCPSEIKRRFRHLNKIQYIQ